VKTIIAFVAPLALCALLAVGPALAAGPWDSLLTAADIEKAIGVAGLKSVPKDPSAQTTGDLNFVRADGRVMVSVTFATGAAEYARRKAEPGAVQGVVPGVGDEAYGGPAKGPALMVIFRKGDNVVTVSTTLLPAMVDGRLTALDVQQLSRVARVIASRL
jgi:hypothetical protein